jgi:hypothetical protein
MRVVTISIAAAIVMLITLVVTRNWMMAQGVFCAILAFAIVWIRQRNVPRSIAAAVLGVAVSTVVAKAFGALLP